MDPPNEKYAIHEAARLGQVSVVESILHDNPTRATLRDEDDRLPLHWALTNHHLPIAEVLAAEQGKKFDVDVKDGLGWTPLMIAASVKDGEDMVTWLTGRGADVGEKNSSGQTALHFAVSKNNLSTARILIAHKASTRVKDKRGQLPLHRAAATGSLPMIQLMLDNKSPVNATDGAGFTALHHAIAEGHGDAALVLLKAGAETDKRDVDGHLAIDLAPDKKVRDFIVRGAESEGIEFV